VVVVLGFDHSNGQVGLIEQQIIGAFALAADRELATDDNAASGEAELATHLHGHVPPRSHDGRGDVLIIDVGFGERPFAHSIHPSQP